MKEITAILLILIAVIGIISIIIVKLYYRDKEKDDEKERLEEFLNSTKADYENEKQKRFRKSARNHENISEAQRYANTINSPSKTEMKDARRASQSSLVISMPVIVLSLSISLMILTSDSFL